MNASSHSLKQRIVWALTSLVVIFVAMQATLAYLSMVDQEDDLVDDLVLSEARRLNAMLEHEQLNAPQLMQLLALSPNFSGWLVDRQGQALPSALPAHLHVLPPGPHLLSEPVSELHVYVMPTRTGLLYVQYDAAAHEDKVRQYGLFLLALVVLCSVLAALAAQQLARVLIAPLQRLTQHLNTWTLEAPQQPTSDEESQLLAAFLRVQTRFEESLAHERQFIANARHEIRTPLSALRTDVEMLALELEKHGAQQQRCQRMLTSIDAISTALALSQTLAQRRRQSSQPLALADCIDNAWMSLAGTPGITRLQLDNRVAREVMVMADRHALLTVLRNLLRNTCEHAAASHCRISYRECIIELCDDGVGIAAHELPHIFDRYYHGQRLDEQPQAAEILEAPFDDAQDDQPREATGSDTRGLGLAIARQVADLYGWQLTVTSTPGQGSCFMLQLTN